MAAKVESGNKDTIRDNLKVMANARLVHIEHEADDRIKITMRKNKNSALTRGDKNYKIVKLKRMDQTS